MLLATALFGAAAIVPATAVAATQTINFDDFTAPAGFETATPLTTRYQPEGVTFSGPAPGKGGAVVNEGGGFGVTGNSPPNFLAFNTGTYAVGPETITFASPATSGSINVGSSSAGSITLTAFDGTIPVAQS